MLVGCGKQGEKSGPSITEKPTDQELMEVAESTYEGIHILTEVEDEKLYHLALSYPIFDKENLNQEITSFVDERKEEFLEIVADIPNPEFVEQHPYMFNVQFTIEQVSDSIYSFLFTIGTYTGGANAMEQTKTYVVDIDNGKYLQIDDVFDVNTDYLYFLSKEIKSRLYEQEEYHDFLFEDMIDEETAPVKENFEKFILTKDSIQFVYDKYEVGAGALGIAKVTIPLQDAAAYLNEQFQPELINEMEENEKEVEQKEEAEQTPIQPDPNKKQVALTFDDGPHQKYTVQILNTLQKYDARATFFVLGSRVEFYPDVLKRIKEEGHEIGNHSWNHPDLTIFESEQVQNELRSTSDAVASVLGEAPTLFRPPYGSYNELVKELSGVPTILWSVDSLDWKYRHVDTVVQEVLPNVHDGAIILLHDIHETTADAVEVIVRELKEQGYEMVTVSELLQGNGLELQSNEVYYSR